MKHLFILFMVFFFISGLSGSEMTNDDHDISQIKFNYSDKPYINNHKAIEGMFYAGVIMFSSGIAIGLPLTFIVFSEFIFDYYLLDIGEKILLIIPLAFGYGGVFIGFLFILITIVPFINWQKTKKHLSVQMEFSHGIEFIINI